MNYYNHKLNKKTLNFDWINLSVYGRRQIFNLSSCFENFSQIQTKGATKTSQGT